MPFEYSARLRVEILSEEGKLSFKPSATNVIPYIDPQPCEQHPRVLSAQRLGAGDPLDTRAWHFQEAKEPTQTDQVPNERLFQLVFEGKEFTSRLRRPEKDLPVLNLYRSIIAEETVRFVVAVGDVLAPLELELSYELVCN